MVNDDVLSIRKNKLYGQCHMPGLPKVNYIFMHTDLNKYQKYFPFQFTGNPEIIYCQVTCLKVIHRFSYTISYSLTKVANSVCVCVCMCEFTWKSS